MKDQFNTYLEENIIKVIKVAAAKQGLRPSEWVTQAVREYILKEQSEADLIKLLKGE